MHNEKINKWKSVWIKTNVIYEVKIRTTLRHHKKKQKKHKGDNSLTTLYFWSASNFFFFFEKTYFTEENWHKVEASERMYKYMH